MSFTRKMFRILTKRILTCLFRKGGLFRILVQNSPKVSKKSVSCKKLLSDKKVAKNPRIC